MTWQLKFLDLSKWQGEVDFNVLRASGYDYVLLRVTSGATYKDEKFHEYYAKAKAAYFKVSGYFVVNPLFTALAHWTNFSDHLGGRKLDVVPTGDVELTGGMSSAVIAQRVKETLELFRANYTAIAGGPICYTASWFWDQYIGAVEWALGYSLHVAQYPWLTPPAELPATQEPTVIPLPWKNAGRKPLAWQWTDKGKLPAVTSSSLDFNVGWDAMYKLVYGYLPGEGPPPVVVDPQVLVRLLALETETANLRSSVVALTSSAGALATKIGQAESRIDAEISARTALGNSLTASMTALREHLRKS